MFIAISEDRDILGVAESRAILNDYIVQYFNQMYGVTNTKVIGPTEYGFHNVDVPGIAYFVECYTIEEHELITP